MIVESTSRDKIEPSVVIQESVRSILAIGQSIIVATQARLRSRSAYSDGQGYSAAKCNSLSGRTI